MNAKSMLFACTLSHGILNNVQWLSRLLLIGRTPLGMGLYFAKAQQNNFILKEILRFGLFSIAARLQKDVQSPGTK